MNNKITDQWQKFLRESKQAVKEKFSPEDFKDVYQTAQMAHVGQKRRDGSDYFSHPSEVRNIARRFYPKDNVVQMAALLHDALEDAPGSTVSTVEEMEDYIKGSIQDPASADEVIRVVRALTHEKGGDYQSYVVDLLGDVPTLRVKLADMVHNLSDNPTPKSKKKYRSALDAIGQKTGGTAPQGISDKHWNTLMTLTSDEVSEEVWDKEDGEYQRSIVNPIRMKEEEELAEEPAKGKKYSKTVTNPKTGRKKKVSYGAKGYRIAPGTSKGDSYCARSYGIKKGLSKDKQNDPNTPNNLSRKKWKCRGKKSTKEGYTTEEIRMVIEDVISNLNESGKCEKGYKTHPTRKTKEMFGKQYRNCIPADEALRTRVRETIVKKLEEEGGCYSGKEICTAGLKFVVNSDSPGIKDVKCEDGVLKNWSARAAQIASKYCKDDNYGRGKKDESLEEGDLQKWADEKWTHSDGTPCGDGREDGSVERCKPKAKWAKMDKGEKAADNAKKRAGTKKGKQNVAATKKGKVTKSYTKR